MAIRPGRRLSEARGQPSGWLAPRPLSSLKVLAQAASYCARRKMLYGREQGLHGRVRARMEGVKQTFAELSRRIVGRPGALENLCSAADAMQPNTRRYLLASGS